MKTTKTHRSPDFTTVYTFEAGSPVDAVTTFDDGSEPLKPENHSELLAWIETDGIEVGR